MDPSIIIFVVGSCVSFLVFYWTFNRHLIAAHARQRAERVRRHGLKKLSFLDGLRHEAGLRAQAAIRAAVDQASRTSSPAAHATIDVETLERVRETRAMLQPLLPHEFIAEFDQIVCALSASPPPRGSELNAAVERLSRRVAEIATAPSHPPVRERVRPRLLSMKLT
jgi:hypothetical protein